MATTQEPGRSKGPSWGRQLRLLLAVYFVFIVVTCSFFLTAASLEPDNQPPKSSVETYRIMEDARADFRGGGMFRELKLGRLIHAECEHQRALIRERQPCDAP